MLFTLIFTLRSALSISFLVALQELYLSSWNVLIISLSKVFLFRSLLRLSLAYSLLLISLVHFYLILLLRSIIFVLAT